MALFEIDERQTMLHVSLKINNKKLLIQKANVNYKFFSLGRGVFIKEKCPVGTCAISSNRMDAADAEMVLFKDHFTMPTFSRPAAQIWMLYLLECPLHTQMFKQVSSEDLLFFYLKRISLFKSY